MGEWSEKLHPVWPPSPCGVQYFASCKLFQLPGPWSPHLSSRSENTHDKFVDDLKNQIWCIYAQLLLTLLARVQAPWPLASDSQGSKQLCLTVADGSMKSWALHDHPTPCLPWVPHTSSGLTSQNGGTTTWPSFTDSHLTSSLHLLLVTISLPHPDL